jgi:type VI secretion system protein ImpF
MPELIHQDRLQPALFDRLTDLAPNTAHETRGERVVSRQQLRQGVLRDLAGLLNTARPCAKVDAVRYPLAAASVLNFGLPDLVGLSFAGLDADALAREIAETLRRFEPRILPNTLRVSALAPQQHANLSFLIEGTLWGQPYPEQLYYRADLDLDDNTIKLRESPPERP